MVLYNGNYIHENLFSFSNVSVNNKHITVHYILSLSILFSLMVFIMIITDEE